MARKGLRKEVVIAREHEFGVKFGMAVLLAGVKNRSWRHHQSRLGQVCF